MTVQAGSIKHVYNGNNTTRNWDFTFSIATADGSDIKLYKTAISGAITEITSNYSVSVVNKYVTYPTVASGLPLLATGEKITLLRSEPLSQGSDWVNQGPFNAETVEAALDKVTMIAQQENEALSRAIKYPVDQIPTSDDTEAFITILNQKVVAAEAAKVAAQAAQTAAEIAKTNAETAKTNAETAETNSETAQAAAEAAQSAAETAKTNAETAETNSETAQAAAESARDTAITAKNDAVTAKNDAVTAKNAAETAETNAETAETNAEAAQVAAEAARDLAQNYAAALKATSTSSIAIATGSKTFTTQAGKQFAAGQFILITSDADPTNYMHGQVTSYTGTSLVVNVLDIGGSGTHTDWTINVSGTQGATGPAGSDEKVKNVSGDAAAGYLAEKLAALYPSLYQRDQKWILKTPYSTAANRYTILTPAKLSVDINGTVYFLTAQAEIALSLEANWDTIAGTDYRTAANRAGKDFYIYACVPVSGSAPTIKLSANSTTPSGYSGTTSRKIGGFHGLCVAVGTISGHTLTDFVAGDVLPASIWDLNFKPKFANPEGMVYSDGINKWVDIYLASGTGASTLSVNGGTISDTRDWNDFTDDGGAVKKKMLTDPEFQVIATGSNEGTNIYGSGDPGTTGGHIDTASRRMISNIGVEDACGALWQWLDEHATMWEDAVTAGWYDLPGDKGQLYRVAKTNDVELVAGGGWDHGVHCGSRGRYTVDSRWATHSDFGCRFCAEPV